jgi:hypothetical protein
MTLHNAAPPVLRPIVTIDPALQARGTALAGSPLSFSELAVVDAGGAAMVVPTAAAAALYPDAAGTLARMARPRTGLGPLRLDRPHTLATLALGDDPTAVLAAGAEGLIVTGAEVVDAVAAATLHNLCRLAPVIAVGVEPESATKAGVAAWQASDWPAFLHATLPTDCLRVTPPPRDVLDDFASVRLFFDSTAAALAAAESRGVLRTAVLVDLGAVRPGAITSLGLLHGLGCGLLAHLDAATGPHAAAASAVLVAGQGIQLMTAPDTEAVATGLALWRSVTTTAPPRA